MSPAVHTADGIAEAHRSTWSRLTRLHTASVTLPIRTTRVEESTRPSDEV